ncbi:2Fe-2S iron-sulfur cluster-binding protein [Thiomicrospira sp.]|nr:2Fe-2S iron-sulfur cluster-binding protein [Thiomicrospira sp.]
MLKLIVNGIQLAVEEGATLLDATKAAGVHVPTLCYHPRLPSHGVWWT